MNRYSRLLLSPLLFTALLLGTVGSGAALADDVDIYRNPLLNSLQPPATIISLDLNLLGVCDNVLLTPPTSTLNPTNQSCVNARATTTLQTLLSPGGMTPLQFLTSLGANSLCALASALGAPNVLCSTISLLNSTALSALTATLAATINGILTPFLPTVVGMLPSTITTALNTALAGVYKVVAAPSSVANVSTLLTSLLNTLINTKVAIIVSHNNLGNATGNPVPYATDSTNTNYPNGNRYACAFNDTSTSSTITTRTRVSTSPSTCSNGAYFVVGFTQLVNSSSVTAVNNLVIGQLNNLFNPSTGLLTNTTTLTTTLQTTLSAITSGNLIALTPPYQGKEIYDEIFHYVDGDTIYNARLNGYDGLYAALGRDTSIESGTSYIAPSLTCRTINVLNIQASNALYDNDSDVDISASTSNYFPGLNLNPAGGFASPQTASGFGSLVVAAQTTGFPATAPAAARYQLNSFFVLQNNLTSVNALNSVGANLLTYSTALGVFNLGQSIANLLKPILSVDASLASAALTDRITLTTAQNVPAFFTEFHPQPGQKPVWPGNLKRLDLNLSSTGALSYVDQTGANGIDPTDGRIVSTAKTIWTNTQLLGTSSTGAVVTTDGRITTLGGAGQNIPGYAIAGGGNPGRKNADGQRTLYYDAINATTQLPTLGNLDADTSTTQAVNDLQGDTGAQAETAANCGTAKTVAQVTQEILLYARGMDTGTSCAGSKGSTNVTGRSWLLGAVLHSRPVPINYGAHNGYTVANPDVRVLYGSADGYLHLVGNGPQTAPTGIENWAFMPRSTMSNLPVLRNNQPATQLPMGVDGAPSVLFVSGTNTATTGVPANVYAYFGLRRSGSNVYGLDLSNPDAPVLMWRIGTDGLYSINAPSPGLTTGPTGQFPELGLTFSSPAIGKIQLAGETNPRRILVFGAGYNGGYTSSGTRIGKDLNNSRNTTTGTPDPRIGTDDQPSSGTGRGNAIYMVDAVTGELLWKAVYGSTLGYSAASFSFSHPLMTDSIPSDVTLLDTDGDGLSDRVYVGDTGGHVWRADFPGTNRALWTVSLLASIGRHGAATSGFADDRRFFLAPDYVPTRDSSGVFDAVIIGTGDREDPYNTVTNNALYMLRDTDTVSGKSLTDTTSSNGVISSESDSRLLTRLNVTDLTTVCASSASSGCAAATNLPYGWQLALTTAGEKLASTPVTNLSEIVFDTFIPTNSVTCSQSEGSGLLYGVALKNSAVYPQFSTATAQSGRSIATKAPGLQGQVGALTAAAIGFNADSLTVTPPPTTRVYWRERRLDDEQPPLTSSSTR